MDIFKTAARNKYRFPSEKGAIDVEDLFDLKLDKLNGIFKTLNSQLKQTEEESLFDSKTIEDEEISVKVEIVKTIFEDKKAEAEALENAAANREKYQKLLAIKERRQNAKYEDMPEEDLDALIESVKP